MGARRPALDRCRGCADSGMNQGEIVRPAKLGPAGRLSWALAPAPTTSISIADLPCSIDSDSILDTIGTLWRSLGLRC
jgi:hypothetical protein